MRSPLDPALRDVLESYGEAALPPWHTLDVEEARGLEADLFTPDVDDRPPVGHTGSHSVQANGHDVPVRLYHPDSPGPHPVLVFCHGGGFVMGTLDSADDLCRECCRRMDRLVVSIDYRLAPEHRFPTGLVDSLAVLEWVGDTIDDHGGDSADIAVAGSSAGGALATGLTRYSVLHKEMPTVSRQLLWYPMLDRNQDRPSFRENENAPFLVPADIEWFWDLYLRHDVDEANPYAVPLADAPGPDLPPTTILTAGHDPLRDDGFAYADRLEDAGVTVEHHHYPSLCHGFLSMADSVPAADVAFDELAAMLE